MDMHQIIISSARGMIEAKRRHEDACHIEHDDEADAQLVENFIHNMIETLFATTVTIELKPGMVLIP